MSLKNNLVILLSAIILSCSGNNYITDLKPGKYENFTLLPNGWKLTPAGKHIEVGDLPLNMVVTKNEKYAVITNSGTSEHSISIIDLENFTETQRYEIDKTWRGLELNEDESLLFVSGGNNNWIEIFEFANGKISIKDTIVLGDKYPKNKISVAGLALIEKSNILLAVTKEDNSLYFIDLSTKKILKQLEMEDKCFEVEYNSKNGLAYVSIWGIDKIAVIDVEKMEIITTIKTDEHPCEMVFDNSKKYLFVTNANLNTTSIIDLEKNKTIEKLSSSLKPNLPPGSTPNSIALSDAGRIFIANADNNYLSVFDISEIGESKSIGFIPTGWYPTSVRYLKKSGKILVASGKGLTSLPNPGGPFSTKEGYEGIEQYIGRMFKGNLSLIEPPSDEDLERYSAQVYENTPYYKKELSFEQSVISEEHNLIMSDKIQHVFYIIKENRTYDQIFGDLPQGNGDSTLCIFPEEVTPNHHKLVTSFTLFDNFYVDAEVSADGHNWSTAAYATDYTEKNWPVLYGRRGGSYDFEGGVRAAKPASGYIWDLVLDKGLIYRNYGEFVMRDPSNPKLMVGTDDYLTEHTCATFPGYNLNISDVLRYHMWKQDFDIQLNKGTIPNLSILRIGNDHTAGTREGLLTPTAYLAQNDNAVGRIVSDISNSPIWEKSIIFILMDDAQNGSDHVDAHRSVLIVVSPYIKRGYVDNTMYSTSSVLKTIELILGLPPMTQYDLSATPILAPITDIPDFSKYEYIEPKVDTSAVNLAGAYGQKRCEEMNLAVEDAIPDIEFNEIIWKAIKGADSEMPAPVRSAFVKINKENEE